MIRLFPIFLACVLQSSLAVEYNPYRLPDAVIPHHYNVFLKPDFYHSSPNAFVLQGNVEIDAEVKKDTTNVTLHSIDLSLGTVSILRDKENLFRSQKYVSDRQWFVFSLKSRLRRGDKIKIKIESFQGPIGHSLFGLYYYTRSSPRSPQQRMYGVTTQMEPTFARQVFPCFDEPVFKATFKISIARKKSHYSLSNMPLIKSEKDPKSEWIVDHFGTTPKMASYLVAVVVTQYKRLTEMHRNVNFTYYYPEGNQDAIQLAIKISKKVFDKLEDYFDIKYPIPKLDQIGFNPRDYKFGGMENYGLITYADSVFYESKQWDNRAWIAGVVLHEIVHQWFGNLVTMEWWDDLWLNEGMTEFFSFIRGKWIEEYKTKVVGTTRILNAMTMETQQQLPPVYVPWARSPEEVLAVVNPVTYSKGGMIIKMAELVMGEDIFKDAMRSYFKSNKYGSVTHNDLWKSFTATSKKHGLRLDMQKILTPWLNQPGFPVVDTKIDYEADTIQFEQNLFYKTAAEYNAQLPRPSEFNYKWPLPIQWMTGNNGKSNISVSFKKKDTIRTREKLYSNDWLVVNPEGNFYYLVNYEKAHWRKLGQHLRRNYQAFDEYTRGKIIFDVVELFFATKSRKGNYVDAAIVNEVLAFAAVETGEVPKALFQSKFRGPLSDQGLKPTYDILKRRRII